jgi:hypothetical protein
MSTGAICQEINTILVATYFFRYCAFHFALQRFI